MTVAEFKDLIEQLVSYAGNSGNLADPSQAAAYKQRAYQIQKQLEKWIDKISQAGGE